jgi:hypothetical protein
LKSKEGNYRQKVSELGHRNIGLISEVTILKQKEESFKSKYSEQLSEIKKLQAEIQEMKTSQSALEQADLARLIKEKAELKKELKIKDD